MAKIAVKTTDGSVQITDNITGVIRNISKGDKWHVTNHTAYATLYWYDDAEVTIFANGEEPGNSIFGASNPAALTAGIASGAIESSSGGGGGSTVSAAVIADGVDQSADIEAIKTSAALTNTKLDSILAELQNSKSIADLLVEDSAGNFYVRQEIYNETTGNSTVGLFNLDGTAASPAPVLPVVPVRGRKDYEVLQTKYVAKTARPEYMIGDAITINRIVEVPSGVSIANVIINETAASLVTITSYSDLYEVEDRQIELLEDIKTRLTSPITVADSLPYRISTEFIATQNGNGALIGDVVVLLNQSDAGLTLTSSGQYYVPRIRSFVNGSSAAVALMGLIDSELYYQTVAQTVRPAPVNSTRVSNAGSQASLGLNKRLRSVIITNLNSTPCFLQSHNSSSALVTGANPLDTVVIGANGTYFAGVSDYGETGTSYGNDPILAFSSSMATLTLVSGVYMINIDYSFEVI